MTFVDGAVTALVGVASQKKRNLQMSGDPHYQPRELKPYLGYDQRVGWYIIVEWAWMLALAAVGVIPKRHARFLTPKLLAALLQGITTTKVTTLERDPKKKVGHDIIALLILMRRILPKELHRWLHWGLTSYDVISTAYALQLRETFRRVFYPKMQEVDVAWRVHIKETLTVRQIGRTHLQNALPITVGKWLSVLHFRFADASRNAQILAERVTGKFSGAVGTSAPCRAYLGTRGRKVAQVALELLGLPKQRPSTQIAAPEDIQRFYNEIRLVSAALANLGDDIRHLQASAIAEVVSASSTSSTMSHKTGNPIVAENADGMHASVLGEFLKIELTVNSTLQRVLTNSSVMRGYTGMSVFTFQQLSTAARIWKSFKADETRCLENFKDAGTLVMGELLHLALQANGYPDAHSFVNKQVVPKAKERGLPLLMVTKGIVEESRDRKLRRAWSRIPKKVLFLLDHPEEYLGDAITSARRELRNVLP